VRPNSVERFPNCPMQLYVLKHGARVHDSFKCPIYLGMHIHHFQNACLSTANYTLRTAVSAAYSLCYSMHVAYRLTALLNRTAGTISLALTKCCFSLLLAHLWSYVFIVRVSSIDFGRQDSLHMISTQQYCLAPHFLVATISSIQN